MFQFSTLCKKKSGIIVIVPPRSRRSRTGNSGNIVGPRIRQARKSHSPRLSQDALSGRMAARGVTIGRAGIAKIETGHRAVSDYEILAFAQSLGVPVLWLLGQRDL
jgi:hypothetical protein